MSREQKLEQELESAKVIAKINSDALANLKRHTDKVTERYFSVLDCLDMMKAENQELLKRITELESGQ